ncbi:MAG: hypothetical protein ACLPKI_31490 [Streptosporangiaceae bacterium]
MRPRYLPRLTVPWRYAAAPAGAQIAQIPGRQALADGIRNRTMLRRAATLGDVGNAAVLAASELARSMTATELNITCGAVVD